MAPERSERPTLKARLFADRYRNLPVDVLAEDAPNIGRLKRHGIRNLGQLIRLSRKELVSKTGVPRSFADRLGGLVKRYGLRFKTDSHVLPRLEPGIPIPLPAGARRVLTLKQGIVMNTRGYSGGEPRGFQKVGDILNTSATDALRTERGALQRVRAFLRAKDLGVKFEPRGAPRLTNVPIPLPKSARSVLTPKEEEVIAARGYFGGEPISLAEAGRTLGISTPVAFGRERVAIPRILSHLAARRMVKEGRPGEIPVRWLNVKSPTARLLERAGIRTIGDLARHTHTELRQTGIHAYTATRLGREIGKYGLSTVRAKPSLAKDIPVPLPKKAMAVLSDEQKLVMRRRGYLGGKVRTLREATPGVKDSTAYRREERALKKIRAFLRRRQ